MRKIKGRVLCWDSDFIERENNLQIVSHKPTTKNIALACDDIWEGVHNGYSSVLKIGDKYRLYYRASGGLCKSCICVAESFDGITFEKVDVGLYEAGGTKHNNIVYRRDNEIDNFAVFYDTNPNCPIAEKFKAIGAKRPAPGQREKLCYFASEDGYSFTEMRYFDFSGTFDTYNVTFWDEDTKQYYLYFRAFHRPNGDEIEDWNTTSLVSDIRDVRVATSPDFVNWTVHGRIKFAEGQSDMPLYTNQISRYYRARDSFIAFPVRYNERSSVKQNLSHMPIADRRQYMTENFGREGTAFTDCLIMTSNDGFTFDRRDEAFLTPGPENRYNWWYGNCYMTYGMVETKADIQGQSKEISMYVGENYRLKSTNFRRMTIRLDGFFSWYGAYKGAELLTKPFVFKGNTMKINFATSAAGGVDVAFCDEKGNALEGYSSYTMFGDSTEREVEFDKPISDLNEKTVRLKISLCDAHLYSFIFE
ncbi:MAG: hypothetical protein E7613_08590 [Ruminococcaceae bacterium]|nr:hypothetical protein [Oscillospiraceae bacterium]